MKMNFKTQGQANAYVLQGKSKEARAARLLEVPDDMRIKAEQHVRTVFAVRNYHRKNRK